jgi:hypothetical protein
MAVCDCRHFCSNPGSEKFKNLKRIHISPSDFSYLVTLSFDARSKTWNSYHRSIHLALCNHHVINSYLRAESCRKESAAKDCMLASLLYPE